ncbi:MAG: hypothetical protein Q9166_000378 [cf. Caloplaca sp. 2 TL-2023]
MPHLENLQGTSLEGGWPPSSSLISPASDLDDSLWNNLTSAPGFGFSQSLGEEHFGHLDSTVPGLSRFDSTPSTETLTMSPHDMHHSAPASNVMTHMSTPQTPFFDSPGPVYSNEPSPYTMMHPSPAINNNLDYDADGDTTNMPTMLMFPDLGGEHDNPHPTVASPTSKKTASMSRKASSPGRLLPDILAIVTAEKNKVKKRTPKHKDIKPDPKDEKSVKRGRNTMAARKSRQRKSERLDALIDETIRQKSEADHHRSEAEIWRRRALARGWQEGED